MVQEDQNQLCSDISDSVGGGGSRSLISSSSSKKLKQKKVPQRGLGVAQLEKIRIEEEEKKDAPNTNNFSTPSTTLSPTLSPLTPNSPFPNYPHNKQSKSSNPFLPSSPLSKFPSPNPIFRSCLFSDIETFNLGLVPSLNPTNVRGFNGGWPPIPTNGNVNASFPIPTNGIMNVSFPILSHAYEFGHDRVGENSRLDHHGFSFQSNLSLPYESCPIGPLPDLLSKRQQCHQPSSLVNISSVNHSSSSMISFYMEPPSSQSCCSSYSPLWPDEEKIMVGMKRPCPFPLNNPLIPPYFGKFATLSTHSMSPSDRTTYENGGTTSNFDPAIPIFREVPSRHSAMLEPPNSKKNHRSENGNHSNKEFLTLASPTITPPFPSSRLKQSSTFLSSQFREFLSFESLPYQISNLKGSIEAIVVDLGQGGSSQQPDSFFNFFPSTKVQVASTSSSTGHNSYNGEVGGSIDLNLRL